MANIRNWVICMAAALMAGCASNTLTVRAPVRDAEPDPSAVKRFIDGAVSDLKQNYAAALLAYQEALLYDSTASDIYLAIANDYYRLGRPESALLTLKRCLTVDPGNLEALTLMTAIHAGQGHWDEAEKNILEILRIDSGNLDAYQDLILIYLERGKKEEAAEVYRQLAAKDPYLKPESYLQWGDICLDLKRYDEAVAAYENFINRSPDEGYGYFKIGLIRETVKDTASAIEYYIRALQTDPDLPMARARLGDLYQDQGRMNDALSLYTEVIQRDSTDLTAWLEIGSVYRLMNDSVSAVATYSDIKKRFPKDWRAFMQMGRMYMDSQRFSPALEEFRKVIQLDAGVVWGWLFSGICLVHLDSIRVSEPYLTKAMEIVPDEPLGNYYLGTVLSQLNRPQEAVPYLEKGYKARPDWVALIITLAGAHESLGNYDRSDSLFHRVLGLEPSNALALNNFGYSLCIRGVRLEEALDMGKKALGIEPDNGAYLDTVGWIYFRMGQYETALDYIEKASTIRVESAEVADHLGDVYEQLGRRGDALEAWKRALEIDPDNEEIKLKRKLKLLE